MKNSNSNSGLNAILLIVGVIVVSIILAFSLKSRNNIVISSDEAYVTTTAATTNIETSVTSTTVVNTTNTIPVEETSIVIVTETSAVCDMEDPNTVNDSITADNADQTVYYAWDANNVNEMTNIDITGKHKLVSESDEVVDIYLESTEDNAIYATFDNTGNTGKLITVVEDITWNSVMYYLPEDTVVTEKLAISEDVNQLIVSYYNYDCTYMDGQYVETNEDVIPKTMVYLNK